MSESDFIKFYNLPIPIAQEPYFSYFLQLYDPIFDTLSKWKNFKSDSNKINNSAKIRNRIIKSIEENEFYKKLINSDKKQWELEQKFKLQTTIYSGSNIGKSYISIDLKEANFSSFNYYNPLIVMNADSFDSFLLNFTQENIPSKKFRQIIFGHLNPKLQQMIQKKIIENIMNDLIKENIIEESELIAHSNDELVILSPKNDIAFKKSLEIKEFLIHNYSNLRFHVVPFFLEGLFAKSGKKLGYKKTFIINEFGEMNKKSGWELKCVPNFLYAQVYKHEAGLEIEKNDTVFLHEDSLCYVDRIF